VQTRMRTLLLVAGLALILAVVHFVYADSSVRIFIDAQELTLDRLPVVVGGHVLVPLRGIFEQLGAVLVWEDPVTHAIIVSRDATQGRGPQVRLAVGSRLAFVNDQPVTLDVPPMVIGGRTLVPLRFVSEGLGAKVEWDAVNRIVRIVPGQPLPPPPARPTPRKGAPAEGIVVQVDLAAVPGKIRIEYGHFNGTYTIASDTTFFRRDLNTNHVEPIQPGQIFPGDAVSLVVEVGGSPPPPGTIRRAYVVVREVTGRVQALADRTLVLSDGRSFTLAETVRFVASGRIIPQPSLIERSIILRIQPLTGEVVEVELAN
jgi:copper amine oxidase-like protein